LVEDYCDSEIRLITFIETRLKITCHLFYRLKRDKASIKFLFKAKWRNQSNNLQEGKNLIKKREK
jgi:hypothetical protein